MSIQVSAVPISEGAKKPSTDGNRHTANFHPSVWGDLFLSYPSENYMEEYYQAEQQVQELKYEVRSMLTTKLHIKNLTEKLNLIDSIQRLGVSYHFETEIGELLGQIYKTTVDSNYIYNKEDLNTTALRFRLLRQHRYPISSDIFTRFKNGRGEFEKSLVDDDVRGLLSLYEAANMRVDGEDILDEALEFSTTELEAAVSSLSPCLAAEVGFSLKYPIRKSLVRVRTKYYMSAYEEDPSHNHVLLTFAKLDFNILQKLHQSELSQLSRWWRDLNFKRELPFVRDRVVEAYFWTLGVYIEPKYSLARRMFSQVMLLDSVLDDIYDAFGTYEELTLLTDAIERWDIKVINQLPNYMQVFYQALLELYEELEKEMNKKGRQYGIFFAKKSLKEQVRAFFLEAKWLKEDYTPNLEEYLHNAMESCGYRMLTIASFLGMDDIATLKAFEWADKNPKLIKESALICRLMDDIVSHKFEQARGHVASAVECYKKNSEWVSEEEIYSEFRGRIENAWKELNQVCLKEVDVGMEIHMRVLNLARVMDLLYKYEDGYTNPQGATKLYIQSILIESVPM